MERSILFQELKALEIVFLLDVGHSHASSYAGFLEVSSVLFIAAFLVLIKCLKVVLACFLWLFSEFFVGVLPFKMESFGKHMLFLGALLRLFFFVCAFFVFFLFLDFFHFINKKNGFFEKRTT